MRRSPAPQDALEAQTAVGPKGAQAQALYTNTPALPTAPETALGTNERKPAVSDDERASFIAGITAFVAGKPNEDIFVQARAPSAHRLLAYILAVLFLTRII